MNATFEEILAAWNSHYDGIPRDNFYESLAFQLQLIRRLKFGKALSEGEIVEATGKSQAYVREFLSQADRMGAELDDKGNLVGAVLTLRRTPHRFIVGSRRMFAWCALDTLFLPALIGEPARVRSTCPVTARNLEIVVGPDRIVSAAPSTIAVSVVDPSTMCCEVPGPESSICSSMHFFDSWSAGQSWVKGRLGVGLCSIEEAFQIAQVTTRFMSAAESRSASV